MAAVIIILQCAKQQKKLIVAVHAVPLNVTVTTYMYSIYIHMLLYTPPEPLSDERAQEIIDKALESSSLQMRNLVAVITDLVGSGKT